MSADSRGVTAGGLDHLRNLTRLKLEILSLSGLAVGFNDKLLYSLHNHSDLKQLALGRPGSLPDVTVTGAAVTRSVRERRPIYTKVISDVHLM